ncbi:MAG TPA: dihydropyrimidinase [Bacteroidales bacterium]|nr:dihydropyrimidinase [Bacteroidales bacterium]HPS63193.1 dihydropyrimidinase [Bacteroidales bacterium]
MNSCLIVNGTLVSRDSAIPGDLLIENGKISAAGAIGTHDRPGIPVIDAAGKYLFPGAIDPHVHLALPTPAGNSCDDFHSGSLAALKGGTTCFFDFVTPHRGQSLREALDFRREEARESRCGWGLHLGISGWSPEIAREAEICIEKEGIRSFKAYLAYRETIGIGYTELEELMRIAARGNAVVMVHAEDGEMIDRNKARLLSEGKSRPCYHAAARPPEAEVMAIGNVISLAAKTGCAVYIVHVSTGKGAELIAEAKRSGIRVFGETCPHYLLLDDSKYDPGLPDRQVLPYIMSPPLRARDDASTLWKALSDGVFDVVATDHCPFNLTGQKDTGLSDFTKIPNGVGGIQHRLQLLYTYGVQTGRISLNRMIDLVATRPAEIFGLGDRKGKLLPGYDADVVIWDPAYRSTISHPEETSTCDSEIYEGFEISGKPEKVLLGGIPVNQ